MSKQIILRQTSILVPDYSIGDSAKLEYYFSFKDVFKRIIPEGLSYDPMTRVLRLPRSADVDTINNYLNREIVKESGFSSAKKMTLSLKVLPRDNNQKDGVGFLIGEGKYSHTKAYSQVALILEPGIGKTYIGIASLTFLKLNTMVIVHNEKIKEQWYNSLFEFTNINEEEVCVLNSSAAIKKIMKMKTPPAKVYIITHALIRSYADVAGWDAVNELFEKTQIGVKIVDECHIEFRNSINMDLYTNVYKTIYLTATFSRAGWQENQLFQRCYGAIPKFGVEVNRALVKHTMYIRYNYNSNPGFRAQKGVRTFRGFDKNRYCDYCMDCDEFWSTLHQAILLVKQNLAKTIVFVSKIDATNQVRDDIVEVLDDPSISVSIVNSQIKGEEREEAFKSDIIVTTTKSMGVGVDIPELTYIILAEPIGSEGPFTQVRGRLRPRKDGKPTFLFDLVDNGFSDIVKMANRRRLVAKKSCKTILENNS